VSLIATHQELASVIPGKSRCRFWANYESTTSGHDIDPTEAMRIAIWADITGKRSANKISEGKGHSRMEAGEKSN
jgi:hypothetical protein